MGTDCGEVIIVITLIKMVNGHDNHDDDYLEIITKTSPVLYPNDHQMDPAARQCLPGCSAHGSIQPGSNVCTCDPGWTGACGDDGGGGGDDGDDSW